MSGKKGRQKGQRVYGRQKDMEGNMEGKKGRECMYAHVCMWISMVMHMSVGFTSCCMTVLEPLMGSPDLAVLHVFQVLRCM
jgi:hypothetical protein